jgi:peptidylprolyl isomerase
MKLRTLAAALLLVLALALGACGDDDSSSDDSATVEQTATEAAAAPTPEPEPAAAAPAAKKIDGDTNLKQKPKVAKASGAAPTALRVGDIVVGKGPAAKAGDNLSVQYVGVRFADGGQFDASWDRGQPFPFVLGQGGVIPGWDQGLVGMKAGGRRQLTIPSDLAYGPDGTPDGSIPPDAALIFVVDLVKIN